MICIARFWIRSNSPDKYFGNPLWKTGQAYSVIGQIQVMQKVKSSFSAILASFNFLRKYNRVEAFLKISSM
jgi:hypothetical protein